MCGLITFEESSRKMPKFNILYRLLTIIPNKITKITIETNNLNKYKNIVVYCERNLWIWINVKKPQSTVKMIIEKNDITLGMKSAKIVINILKIISPHPANIISHKKNLWPYNRSFLRSSYFSYVKFSPLSPLKITSTIMSVIVIRYITAQKKSVCLWYFSGNGPLRHKSEK